MKPLLLGLLLAISGINLALMMSGKTYVYRTLLHQQPGIYDLELFASRPVTASPTPREWRRTKDYNQRRMPTQLRATLNGYNSTQFLVLQDGKLSFEKYWNEATPETLSNAFSATKSIVAVLIGIALQDQSIHSVDDKVAKYLATFDTPAKRHITLRNVLSMASGLSFSEDYAGLFSDTAEAYYGTNLEGLIERLSISETPGEFWRYRSGDTQILAMVLAAATGMSISEFASQRLWAPLGATTEARWSLDSPGGTEKAYCCFYSNARDLARVGELYRNGGVVNSHQLVHPDFVLQSVRANRLIDKAQDTVDWYGMHWWLIRQRNTEVFYARGILGQYIFVIPERGLVAVRLGHERGEKVDHHPSDVPKILNGLLDMYPERSTAY